MPAPEGQFVTSDLSLAAFLQHRGLRLLHGRLKGNEYEFAFDDPKEEADALSVEWTNSCCKQFESRILGLKSLINTQRRNGRR